VAGREPSNRDALEIVATQAEAVAAQHGHAGRG
jgi:hypothetical protein